MRHSLWIIIVTLELLCIGWLFKNIAHAYSVISNKTSITILNKHAFTRSQTAALKYFYELTPHASGAAYLPEWLAEQPVTTVNDDTLNERFDYTKEKAKNTYRIVTLGDSWTFGMFVNTKDNYSEKLEDLLNTHCPTLDDIDVINLGVPSYDIQYALERFKIRGRPYDPDLVIWLLGENDFTEIEEIVLTIMDRHKKEATQMNKGIIKNSQKDWKPYTKPETRDEYTFWQQAIAEQTTSIGSENILRFQESKLRELRNYFPNTVLFFTIPQGNDLNIQYRDILRAIQQSETNVLYYESSLNLLYPKDRLFPDQHPNPYGHTLIAEDLFTYLTKNDLISCKTE